jgi:hypothetical protein
VLARGPSVASIGESVFTAFILFSGIDLKQPVLRGYTIRGETGKVFRLRLSGSGVLDPRRRKRRDQRLPASAAP